MTDGAIIFLMALARLGIPALAILVIGRMYNALWISTTTGQKKEV